ncbi:Ohr family peroxiredoxin [Limobrevibacterium gyesilva]|uniref:Ohr family peroxiredoxin n=1 Tax=Limobrevibacterium gyesilva TaxID=2991712 RepID=A0AA41YQB4_9PROT|nr:Ohr family peroxiredoxin [Limobrevibacterium gyesilva]
MYTAKTHTTGGREDGASPNSDGRLGVELSLPDAARIGANPEQLFAPDCSACHESAIGLAVRRRKITLPVDLAIDAEVDLHLAEGDYLLSARLNIRLPAIKREVAQTLKDEAHQNCPHSQATRGSLDIAIDLV